MAFYEEINLVCMSGQGSVQTAGLLARGYYEQHGLYVASKVSPGARSTSNPVVSYLRVSDRPCLAISSNYHPNVVIVFWDGLLRVADKVGDLEVHQAIAGLEQGILIVNTKRSPEEVPLPFRFEGTVVTVDASEIGSRLLHRDPAPVGVTLLGAYLKLTGALGIELIEELVRDRFRSPISDRNIAAMHEAADKLQVLENVKSASERRALVGQPRSVDELPELVPPPPLLRGPQHGLRDGGGNIWRSQIPVCEDTKCICKGFCVSEASCPEATGFIVRKGLPHQGYRIDVDFCKGCGSCAEVCIGDAITMVNEEEVLKTRPDYEDITVEPYMKKRRRFSHTAAVA